MRAAWFPLGLVSLAVAVTAPLACGQAFQATGGTGSSSSVGGSTASAGGAGDATTGVGGATSVAVGTAGSTTSGAPACSLGTDCPGSDSVCGIRTCENGLCKLNESPAGLTASQIYGDCHVFVCKDGQVRAGISVGDIYDDGNECTVDSCDQGTPVHTIKSGPCGSSGVCDDKGACVQCNLPSDCGPDFPFCIGGYCAGLLCMDGMKDGKEVGIDCGGDCGPCPDDTLCTTAADCLSGVCSIKDGDNVATCNHNCMDGVKNGDETGKDCGGKCSKRCPAGSGCLVPTDCNSQVCQAGKCKGATCTDGVMNNGETGVDCGGNCPTTLCFSGG